MNRLTFITIIGVLVIVTSFYWFGIRPGEVRKDCWESAKKMASDVAAMEMAVENKGQVIEKKADYEKVRGDRYKACLLEHGLAQ